MKDTFKIIGFVLLGTIVFLAFGFGMGMFNFQSYKFFAPKYENVRREVFENTQSYVEGKRQEALKYYKEYNSTTDEQEKKALEMVIVQSFANFDTTLLEPKLENFITELKFK